MSRGFPRGIVRDEAPLAASIKEARARGEIVVMTNGCFDLLHAGHVAYLRQARALGDYLVVAINSDHSLRRLKGALRPITPLSQRLEILSELTSVDCVIAFEEDTPRRLYCNFLPSIVVKGGDYAEDEIVGADCVRAAGGQTRVLDHFGGLSTQAIIKRIIAKS